MIIIAHRGNINGKEPNKENSPEYIQDAISLGYGVEVDIWELEGELWLGHDRPTYSIETDWLLKRSDDLWIHAKNLEVVEILATTNLNWFWHSKDKMTLTSKTIPWCYGGIYMKNGITVELGIPKEIPEKILGICTDYAKLW